MWYGLTRVDQNPQHDLPYFPSTIKSKHTHTNKNTPTHTSSSTIHISIHISIHIHIISESSQTHTETYTETRTWELVHQSKQMVIQKKPKTEQMMMMIKLVDNYMFLSRWRISNSLLILFLMFMVLFLLLVLGILPKL